MSRKRRIFKRLATATVVLPPRFVAKDHFIAGNAPDGVVLYAVGNKFKELFGDVVEKNNRTTPTKLHVYQLRKPSPDADNIADLGPGFEAKLSHVWAMVKKQGKGQDGPLSTKKGYANVFYVRGRDGILWIVSVYYRIDRKWRIKSYPTTQLNEWDDGTQIISPA